MHPLLRSSLLIIGILAPSLAFVCSCMEQSPQEAYDDAHFVFSGSVTGTEIYFAPSYGLEPGSLGEFMQRTVFSIERIWKGPRVNGFVFETLLDSGANCGRTFAHGEDGMRLGYFGWDDSVAVSKIATTNSCVDYGAWGIDEVLGEGEEPEEKDCTPLVCRGVIHPRCDSEGKLIDVSAVCNNSRFSDIDDSNDVGLAVYWLAERGFLKGDPDGTFRPSDSINRAEFATVVSRFTIANAAVEKCVAKPAQRFSDVPGDAWYAKSVCALKQKEVVRGYPDETFRPDQPVTVAEAAKNAGRKP